MRLMGTKYLAGGPQPQRYRRRRLIQLALAQCGVPAPRDLDMQISVGPNSLPRRTLRRGDVVIAAPRGRRDDGRPHADPRLGRCRQGDGRTVAIVKRATAAAFAGA
jgi:cell wall-associated NlpC family hydrolase